MFRIWTRVYKDGELVGEMKSVKEYVRIGNAVRVALNKYGANVIGVPEEGVHYEWIVSRDDPFIH